MENKRDRVKGTVYLSQKQYLQKVLNKFSIDKSAKLIITLLVSQFKLSFQLSPRMRNES